MRDVAAAADVSTALVSIVFRGAPGASAETRARVFAAAERLGYRTASLMKRRRTKHLGVTMGIRNAFHAELVDGIQSKGRGLVGSGCLGSGAMISRYVRGPSASNAL